jgi:hypothetical protein
MILFYFILKQIIFYGKGLFKLHSRFIKQYKLFEKYWEMKEDVKKKKMVYGKYLNCYEHCYI